MLPIYVSLVVVVVVQGILWITTKKALNMGMKAVDEFVNNPSRIDKMTPLLQSMGTSDLAMCLVFLSRQLRAARAEHDQRAIGLMADRLGRVERELERRQLTFDEFFE
jgi:hypothetical protein